MGSERRAPAWVVAESAARALRFELGLGHGPIDIYDVIERRKVLLTFRDLDGDDGRYVFHRGTAVIMVSSACEEATRQRFTAAHELGHHEMHRFMGEEEAETYIVDHRIFAADGDRRETEANAFASTLLLPTEALRTEFPSRDDVTLDAAISVMRRYRVSLLTAVYRLHNVGLITARRRDALLKEGEGQVRTLRGRNESLRVDELPAQLEQTFTRLYRAGALAPERVAQRLEVSLQDLTEQLGQPPTRHTTLADLLTQIEQSTVEAGQPEPE